MLIVLQKYSTTLKTLSLVGGIAIVLALQLGLTTYISTSDISEKSFSIVHNADESVAPLNSGSRLGPATLYAEDLVEDVEVHALPVASRREISRSSIRRDLPREKVVRRTIHNVTAKKLEKVVASKAKTEVRTERTPEVRSFESSNFAESDLVADDKEDSNRRSFVSVIKKPYSWVKALGSKIF